MKNFHLNVSALLVLLVSLIVAGLITEHPLGHEETQPIGATIGHDVVLDNDLRVRVTEVSAAQTIWRKSGLASSTTGRFLVVGVQAAEHGSGATGTVQCHLNDEALDLFPILNDNLIIPATGFQSTINMIFELPPGHFYGWSIRCSVSTVLIRYSREAVIPVTPAGPASKAVYDKSTEAGYEYTSDPQTEVIPQ